MLPQSPAESGYYVYGNLFGRLARGAYQYAHPIMMTAILRVASQWQARDKRRFGIGDISLAMASERQIMTRTEAGLKSIFDPCAKTALNARSGGGNRSTTRKLLHS